MNDYEIPWDELFEGVIADSTVNVPVIMQGYCDRIKSSSHGLVLARFDELKIVRKVTGGSILSATNAFLPREETYEENALSQKNINKLYEPSVHVFDIYNESYQFRLCELSYGATYPIEIQMDDGVQDEIKEELNVEFEKRGPVIYVLRSDDELRSCFKRMFMCRKMKNILLQLRQS